MTIESEYEKIRADVSAGLADVEKVVPAEVNKAASWAERNPYWTLSIVLAVFWLSLVGAFYLIAKHH